MISLKSAEILLEYVFSGWKICFTVIKETSDLSSLLRPDVNFLLKSAVRGRIFRKKPAQIRHTILEKSILLFIQSDREMKKSIKICNIT